MARGPSWPSSPPHPPPLLWQGTAGCGSALPKNAVIEDDHWTFELPKTGIEPLLKALLDGGAGIEELSVERRGLHDAFVAIAGESAAREMEASASEDAA